MGYISLHQQSPLGSYERTDDTQTQQFDEAVQSNVEPWGKGVDWKGIALVAGAIGLLWYMSKQNQFTMNGSEDVWFSHSPDDEVDFKKGTLIAQFPSSVEKTMRLMLILTLSTEGLESDMIVLRKETPDDGSVRVYLSGLVEELNEKEIREVVGKVRTWILRGKSQLRQGLKKEHLVDDFGAKKESRAGFAAKQPVTTALSSEPSKPWWKKLFG